MHTVSYAGDKITRDEGALPEYGFGILVRGVGIGSHDEEGYGEGGGMRGVVALGDYI